MIVAVPADTPVTRPAEPIEAMPVLLLLQVPPDAASLSITEEPTQTDMLPVMGAMLLPLTVITVVATVVPQLLLTL